MSSALPGGSVSGDLSHDAVVSIWLQVFAHGVSDLHWRETFTKAARQCPPQILQDSIFRTGMLVKARPLHTLMNARLIGLLHEACRA